MARQERKNKKQNHNMVPAFAVKQAVKEEMERQARPIKEEAVQDALVLLFSLPCITLMEDFWPKSYETKLKKFVNLMMERYRKWEDGELDIEELNEKLWDIAGIKFGLQDVE